MVLLSSYNPYLFWDTSFLERGIAIIWQDMGAAFAVGILGFAMIFGLIFAFRVIAWLLGG